MTSGRNVPRSSCVAALSALVVASGWARAEEMVIESDDMPSEVGTRMTYAFAGPDGRTLGQVRAAVIGKRTHGPVTLCRESVIVGQTRIGDSWLGKSDEEYASYPSFGATHPDWKIRLPLRAGLTYEYTFNGGEAKVRVEGPEEVEVPAGKIDCLVCVEDRTAGDRSWEQRIWIAPAVGLVKIAATGDEAFAVSLVRNERPREVVPEEGTDVVCTFDSDATLGSPLFPQATWMGLTGQPGRASVVEVEPAGGAAGTPFCMRWTYHTKGTWVAASIEPSGDRSRPVDLSDYESISFYVKGLAARDCSLTVRAKAADAGRVIMVHLPVKVTTEWRHVEMSGDSHPQLRNADVSRTYSISFGDYDEGEASNVVWIDEIKLHRERQTPVEDAPERF